MKYLGKIWSVWYLARKCKDISVAEREYYAAPAGPEERIWERRRKILARRAVVKEAAKCTDAATAKNKCETAYGALAKKKWEERWIELHYGL
ncbi:MAG TPA: hypothetical protein ENI56_02710 [Candidatus Kaiserbacteria bacterium]|nr:hypothetical protein [Candidatus Kaiserbacteria bacterium]